MRNGRPDALYVVTLDKVVALLAGVLLVLSQGRDPVSALSAALDHVVDMAGATPAHDGVDDHFAPPQ